MLTHPCETLPGIGPAVAKKLAKCHIHTIQDLLFHLPYRYQDRTRVTPIQDVRPNDWCVISGTISKTHISYGKRPILNCYIEDKTGLLKLRFFHFNKNQVQKLKEAPQVRAFGEVKVFSGGMEMIHPEYQILQESEHCLVEENLTPIYPSTQGLSQNRIRLLIKEALKISSTTIEKLEWMTPEMLSNNQLLRLSDALPYLHCPPPDANLKQLEEGKHPALKRLVFDELLAHRLSMQFARKERKKLKAPLFLEAPEQEKTFLNLLPFSLTGAQQRVVQEIHKDLASDAPMLRLVQGDVGAGKTVVATLAAIQAIASGYQVALMAPTDILSEQHFLNIHSWLADMGYSVGRLTGKMKARERKEVLSALAAHEIDIVIGTHALFQSSVNFAKLGLAIIDEQHRFGVEQRLSLQEKGQNNQVTPHQLLMTATPIPRTLAMTHFAHIDLSVLDELPPGRSPVITKVICQDKREQIVNRLHVAIKSGRQAYWVCTLIEESDALQCQAAEETATLLKSSLTDINVGLVHGRMKAQVKDSIMTEFKLGKIQLLVATTVIEVGVDVPNASLMIIENSERLGLSQLHQLRGRVGRGSSQSHCLLLYQSPLSTVGQERLQVMRDTTDGFVIADKDLQLRGSGEFLGTRQTGYKQYKVAELPRDQAILELLPEIAKTLAYDNLDIAQNIANRWLGEFANYLQG